MEGLAKSVQFLKGVGPKRKESLGKMGVNNIFDLLWYIPRSYFDWGQTVLIADLVPDSNATINGVVKSISVNRSRSSMAIIKTIIQDESDFITAIWFNQRHVAKILEKGQRIAINGKVKLNNGYEIHVAQFQLMDKNPAQNKILPIYPLTEGINQGFLRNLLIRVLADYLPFYPEIIDKGTRLKCDLPAINVAFRDIHFPPNKQKYLKARRRLALEELLLFQTKLKKEKRLVFQKSTPDTGLEKTDLLEKVSRNLPFELTGAQNKVIKEIFVEMESPYQMNRLLQGDVGSGKTIVAALAMAKAVARGFQAALMVPTEILALQHNKTINKIFSGCGVNIACLTGSTPVAKYDKITNSLKEGMIDILIGTHALIQERVKFKNLGLVIIDEQQRFGVKQRGLLGQKDDNADILIMTATPIPRTLALTVYGNLGLSVIDELPPGRKEIKTVNVNYEQRNKVYQFIGEKVKQEGIQAYIVCPLVQESEKIDLQAAVSLYEELRTGIFAHVPLGLIHGKMNAKEKEIIMDRFKEQKIKILISTSVIEVGVDVPQATIIAIEHAERFGLAQLHQLRGRIGRGRLKSYCFLIGNPQTVEAYRRLKAIAKTTDGFKLAEQDLLIRGAGDFWGVKQHGLDELKIAHLSSDKDLIELSQKLGETVKNDQNILEKYLNLKFGGENIARN